VRSSLLKHTQAVVVVMQLDGSNSKAPDMSNVASKGMPTLRRGKDYLFLLEATTDKQVSIQ
jgi:hypothetical protein